MNRYELTYIIDTALEETARKELIEKVSALIAANGGEVEKVDETWGKRRLAYAADDVEFLTSRNEAQGMGGYAPAPGAPAPTAQSSGFTAVETDELPF